MVMVVIRLRVRIEVECNYIYRGVHMVMFSARASVWVRVCVWIRIRV